MADSARAPKPIPVSLRVNEAVGRSTLPSELRHFLMVLAHLANHTTGEGYSSQATIASWMGCSERQVRRYFAEVEALGKVSPVVVSRRRRGRNDGRGRTTDIYRLEIADHPDANDRLDSADNRSPTTARTSVLPDANVHENGDALPDASPSGLTGHRSSTNRTSELDQPDIDGTSKRTSTSGDPGSDPGSDPGMDPGARARGTQGSASKTSHDSDAAAADSEISELQRVCREASENPHSQAHHKVHERAELAEANRIWCSALGLTVRPLRMHEVDSRTRAATEIFASGYKLDDVRRMALAAKTDAWVRGDGSEPPKGLHCLTPTVAARLLDSLEHSERKAKARTERKAQERAAELEARRKETEKHAQSPFDLAKIFARPQNGPSIPEGAPRRMSAEEIDRALQQQAGAS